MDTQLRRGLLEVCTLAVLRREDSYGYRLVRDVGEIIPITESTLYPILKRLEAAQMVGVYSVEHNGRLRKYFHLTDEGDARIRRFLDEWKEVVRICRMIEEEQIDEGGRRHE